MKKLIKQRSKSVKIREHLSYSRNFQIYLHDLKHSTNY
jgi:hypothetical protein